MEKCENLHYLWNGKNGGIGLKGKKRNRNEQEEEDVLCIVMDNEYDREIVGKVVQEVVEGNLNL